jgi:carboxymethylenebutenolidase
MTLQDMGAVELTTATGRMRTYVFRPAQEARYPGIVLFSEIFQVTAPIARTAAILAGAGFIVAVPEVYHELEPAGTVLAYDQAGADLGNKHKYEKELSSYDSDARAVLDYLHSRPDCTGRLGVMGICLGGHLAYRAALNSDVLAAACLYATDLHSATLGRGKHDDSLARASELRGELLFIWGRQDPHVPTAGRDAIKRQLEAVGTNYQWMEFNAAHAFMRDEGYRYDPDLARTVYDIVCKLFHRRLMIAA